MKSAVLLLAFGLASGVAWAAPASVPVAGPSETEETHAALKAAFAEAYLRYPRLPQGVLEAQAFVASRWQHRVPEAPYAGHHGMPQSYGVMGLYRGQPGFADQVGAAAKLLGLSPERVARDLHSNVVGAAALLDSALGERSKVGRIEDISEALQNLSGILPAQASATAYARANHAFDLLLTLDRGHDDDDDDGIRIAPKAIAFERAFDVDTLVKMRAPFVRLDLDSNRIETEGLRLDPISETLIDNGAKAAVAKSTDYGPALWQASPNYSARNASASHVTIHTTQGSYAGPLSWLTNPVSRVSAHYLIRSSDGQVAQMVRESSKAWHVGNHNPYTLGIEHEGWVDQTGWYTTAMYSASSALTRHFCARYSIPCSSAYTGATGVTLAMAVDDSDGTERSSARSLPANQWTYLEWKLDDSAQWSAWVGGNGVISSSQVTLDAIWIYRAQTSYTVHLSIDDVQYRFEG